MELCNSMMHKKEVKAVSWIIEGIEEIRPIGKNEHAYLSSEYYGDHTENWIIIESHGKEVERHNTKNMYLIVWK